MKDFRVPVPRGAELQALRAVEILGRIGTPEACQLLERLAGGAGNGRDPGSTLHSPDPQTPDGVSPRANYVIFFRACHSARVLAVPCASDTDLLTQNGA